jgi:HK97 family phage portal protein
MEIRKAFNRFGHAIRSAIAPGPLSMSALLSLFNDGDATSSGEVINHHSALQISWVYQCVRVIAESVGSLPLKLYEMQKGGRVEAVDHDIYFLLAVEPNPEMSAVTFWETMTGCLAMTGNCYAQIVRSIDGSVAAIYPLHPLKTEPIRDENGKLVYRTTDGESAGSFRIVKDADIIHVRLFGWDGLKGLSPIMQARETLGLAKAAVKFGAKWFWNSARPTGMLSTSTPQDTAQQEQVRASWKENYGGKKQGGTAVLFGDWKWQSITVSPEESQFLGTQAHSRTDVAALFRLAPHMIGDTSRLSNSNHENQSLEFVTDTLRPYLCRFEVEILRKLLPRLGRKAGKYVAKFDVRERLRGDFQTMMAGLALGRQWGFLTANMCLAELDENPIGPVGDVLMYPTNMGNAEALLHETAKMPPAAAKAHLAAGKPDGKPAASDVGEGVVVPAENRSALAQYTVGYIRLFRDGFGRVAAREQRDAGTIQSVFGALLASIQDQAATEAAARLELRSDWNRAGGKIVADALKLLTRRAEDWTPEGADAAAGDEFRRVLKTVVTNTYREAGAAAFTEMGEAA